MSTLEGNDAFQDRGLIKLIGKDGVTSTYNVSEVTSNGEVRTLGSSLAVEVSRGNVSGATFIHKFGVVPDFDTGDNSVHIWDGADDGGSDLMQYTFSTTDDIDSLSSSDNGDTQDVEVQGLDANFDLVTQTITLTGQTRVALTTDLVRVFRMINRGSTDFAGTVYCFKNVATTLGVPDTLANVRAQIVGANNQTLMAIYTIPNGKTGFMRSWYASIAGANKSSNYVIDLFARLDGEVFQLKHRSAIDDSGTSYIQHDYVEPKKFEAKTDITMKADITSAGVTGATVAAGFDLLLIDN